MLPLDRNVRFGGIFFDHFAYKLGISIILTCPNLNCPTQQPRIVYFGHQGVYHYGCSTCKTRYFSYDWNSWSIRDYAYHHILGMNILTPMGMTADDFADEVCEKFIRYHC